MDQSNLPRVSSPLPWHGREWKLLNAQLADGKLPHALLLDGRQHTGKSQLALALARLLLCSSPKGSLNCGECHACALSASGGHGDFRWVKPSDKSRIIKIEQIRDVVRFTNHTAALGIRKVVVLAPADSMNIHAFNALLKSLEEPASNTYWILVCDRTHGIPATIRSRCHRLRLATPEPDLCLDWLDESTGNRAGSSELLALADGLPLLAKQIYSEGRGKALTERRLGIEALLGGDITVQQAAAAWGESDVRTFLEDIAVTLQNILRSLSLNQLNTKQSRDCFGLLDQVNQLQRAAAAGANPGKQLVVDAILSKFHRQLGPELLGDTIRARRGDAGI
jgi:DNA polymerase-3 subunit delta'